MTRIRNFRTFARQSLLLILFGIKFSWETSDCDIHLTEICNAVFGFRLSASADDECKKWTATAVTEFSVMRDNGFWITCSDNGGGEVKLHNHQQHLQCCNVWSDADINTKFFAPNLGIMTVLRELSRDFRVIYDVTGNANILAKTDTTCT